MGGRLWIDFCVLRKFVAWVIIVDCRRGLGNLDLLLLDGFVARPVLVILSKADKINREKLILAQREAEKTLSELSPSPWCYRFRRPKKPASIKRGRCYRGGLAVTEKVRPQKKGDNGSDRI